MKVAMPERTLFLTLRSDPVCPWIISTSSDLSTVSTKLLNIGVDKCRLESKEENESVVAMSGLTYCQNPNSTNNSIELNLRLDYILTP